MRIFVGETEVAEPAETNTYSFGGRHPIKFVLSPEVAESYNRIAQIFVDAEIRYPTDAQNTNAIAKDAYCQDRITNEVTSLDLERYEELGAVFQETFYDDRIPLQVLLDIKTYVLVRND